MVDKVRHFEIEPFVVDVELQTQTIVVVVFAAEAAVDGAVPEAAVAFPREAGPVSNN